MDVGLSSFEFYWWIFKYFNAKISNGKLNYKIYIWSDLSSHATKFFLFLGETQLVLIQGSHSSPENFSICFILKSASVFLEKFLKIENVPICWKQPKISDYLPNPSVSPVMILWLVRSVRSRTNKNLFNNFFWSLTWQIGQNHLKNKISCTNT
jgi:hypothetical protein